MHPLFWILLVVEGMVMTGSSDQDVLPPEPVATSQASTLSASVCNCNIVQGGNSYPINALMGTQNAAAFYAYGNPVGSSANTGLEISNTLVLFLYENITNGEISFMIIADIANDGTGGVMTAEINCLPPTAFVSVQDDAGEMTGTPPLITGNWSWAACCTDGGVIDGLTCTSSYNIDLLASSGIDSIVWLTGDILNPDHILMSMSGEAIYVDCGGGICCPVDLDTEVTITDATCEDTPNGAIALLPQDGIPQYTYDWSNGASTQNVTGLLPGTYDVTITDSQGCSEELSIIVDVSPGSPQAQSADIDVCSNQSTGIFDLTTLTNAINGGTSFDVLWFENMDLTGAISNPSAYSSESGIIWAVVDNGPCLSEPVPVNLTVILQPVAMAVTLHACEETNGMATFDLTDLSGMISGGAGSVSFYLDVALNSPVADPTAFFSSSTTVYAVVNDGTCISEPAEVELVVDLKPVAMQASLSACADEFGQAEFDLTSVDIEVSGGVGDVEWYEDMALTLMIQNPTGYVSGSGTVYVTVFDGTCYSDAVPVFLIAEESPSANAIAIEMCDDGTGYATFNLWDFETAVSGGSGGVSWYFDSNGMDPIPTPGNFNTLPVTIYAVVDNGLCLSDIVPILLEILQTPVASSTFLETCADTSGLGIFNLTLAEPVVSGGNGTVTWYEDAAGLILIDDPTMYQSSGWTVYAQVADGPCLSALVPVELMIVNTVSATSVDYPSCDLGNGMALFDLTTIENAVSNGTGQVNWFWDPTGMQVISNPQSLSLSDTVIYANVIAGACTSETVSVQLIVQMAPTATGVAIQLCGDSTGQIIFDLTTLNATVSGGSDTVFWFGDPALSMQILNPAAFQTGDTMVYATVSNGICSSPPVAVLLSVMAGVIPNPLALDFCLPAGSDTLVIDLTQFNNTISGGAGQVNWYSDESGSSQIADPTGYPGVGPDTLFASVQSGGCESLLVPIGLNILPTPQLQPFSFRRCGDINGLVTIDLTSADVFISGGIGIVSWYVDPALTMLVSNAMAFTSGDTVIFASVANDFCQAPVLPVPVEVVDSLTAQSVTIGECLPGGGSVMLDLTAFDFAISGGNGNVIWFLDALGMDTIPTPTAFGSSGGTLYAQVSADGCTSGIVPIPVVIADFVPPEPLCVYSSIDSVGMTWAQVAGQYTVSYTVNGQMAGGPIVSTTSIFGVGGLNQGDTVVLTVTAMYDSICPPSTAMVECVTDVCPDQVVGFIGLDTGYCRSVPFVLLSVTPPGGMISGDGVKGDTLFPALVQGGVAQLQYTWVDPVTTCVYGENVSVDVFDPLPVPQLSCVAATLNSVLIEWSNYPLTNYTIEVLVNQVGWANYQFDDGDIMVDGLNEGDEVAVTVFALDLLSPCGNSDTISITCFAESCPDATLTIIDPGMICSDEPPYLLQADVAGLPGNPQVLWTIDGMPEDPGMFDPALHGPGGHMVIATIDAGGCLYRDTLLVTVLQAPLSAFEITGSPCLDSLLTITFTGSASVNATFDWDLDGGTPIGGNMQDQFFVQWDDAGVHVVQLGIDDAGCVDQSAGVNVNIQTPLEPLIAYCVEEDFFSVTIGWDPVPGAVGYEASSDLGIGAVNGNQYTIRQLPDDTTVTVTIVALSDSPCGISSTVIQCHTVRFIPVVVFVPNVFSPNHDHVNDVLFVQGNEMVERIMEFRIFDRWGGVVFEDAGFLPNDEAHGWDGTVNNEAADPGVFVYYARVLTTEGREIVLSGDVTLVR